MHLRERQVISPRRSTNYHACSFRDFRHSSLLEAGNVRVNKAFRFPDIFQDLFKDCPTLSYHVRNKLTIKGHAERNRTNYSDGGASFPEDNHTFVFQHYTELSKYIEQYRYYHTVGGVCRKTMGDPRELGIEPATRSDQWNSWLEIPSGYEDIPSIEWLIATHLGHESSTECTRLQTGTSEHTSQHSKGKNKLSPKVKRYVTSPDVRQPISAVSEDTHQQFNTQLKLIPKVIRCTSSPDVHQTTKCSQTMKQPLMVQSVRQQSNVQTKCFKKIKRTITTERVHHRSKYLSKVKKTSKFTNQNVCQRSKKETKCLTKAKRSVTDKNSNQKSSGHTKCSTREKTTVTVQKGPKISSSTINYLQNIKRYVKSLSNVCQKSNIQNKYIYLSEKKRYLTNEDARGQRRVDTNCSSIQVKRYSMIQNGRQQSNVENRYLRNIHKKSNVQNKCFPKVQKSVTKEDSRQQSNEHTKCSSTVKIPGCEQSSADSRCLQNIKRSLTSLGGYRKSSVQDKCFPKVRSITNEDGHQQSSVDIKCSSRVNKPVMVQTVCRLSNGKTNCAANVNRPSANEDISKESDVKSKDVSKPGMIKDVEKDSSDEIVSSQADKTSIINEDVEKDSNDETVLSQADKTSIINEDVEKDSSDEIVSSQEDKKCIINGNVHKGSKVEAKCSPKVQRSIVNEDITSKESNTETKHSQSVKRSTTNKDVCKESSVDKIKCSTKVQKSDMTQNVDKNCKARSHPSRVAKNKVKVETREESSETTTCLPRMQPFFVTRKFQKTNSTENQHSSRLRATFVVGDRNVSYSLIKCPQTVGCSAPMLHVRQGCVPKTKRSPRSVQFQIARQVSQ